MLNSTRTGNSSAEIFTAQNFQCVTGDGNRFFLNARLTCGHDRISKSKYFFETIAFYLTTIYAYIREKVSRIFPATLLTVCKGQVHLRKSIPLSFLIDLAPMTQPRSTTGEFTISKNGFLYLSKVV